MKYVFLCLILFIASVMAAVSIYNVQYTNTPGIDNSYPSPYTGKTVTVEGIVTAVDFRNGSFFISEVISGPWRGIMITDRKLSPNIGDKVRLNGTVRESFGMTCIQDIGTFQILDRNCALPQQVYVTTGQLNRADLAEAYEGVMIKVQNATCSQANGSKGSFFVTDGTGQCVIRISEFSDRGISLNPKIGDQYNSIIGILSYGFGEYALNPRTRADINLMQPVFNQNRSWGKIKSIYK